MKPYTKKIDKTHLIGQFEVVVDGRKKSVNPIVIRTSENFPSSTDWNSLIPSYAKRDAVKHDCNIFLFSREVESDKTYVRLIPNDSEYTSTPEVELVMNKVEAIPEEQAVPEIDDIPTFIKNSVSMKPKTLFIQDLRWKYLVRSVLRGKNLMLVGPTGCGKTVAAKSVQSAFNRPSFYFNLGATQDPRSALIGNTHYDKERGTFHDRSEFIEAISTPNAIVLLDEFTRAHPEAHNILMTALDPVQRYIRIDEEEGHQTVEVAEGVCFIATANIGAEYAATRRLDRAMLDRFSIIEVDPLDNENEFQLLQQQYPTVNNKMLKALAETAQLTRTNIKSEESDISTIISTRTNLEAASLIYDGFEFEEAVEITIYPLFDDQGGTNSERTFVKQAVQKNIPADGWGEDLTTGEELFEDTSSTPSADDDLFTMDDINFVTGQSS